MRYQELTENYSPEEDSMNTIEVSDVRKSRLTLIHLSKLRNIREYRKYENSKRADRLSTIYGAQSEEGGDLEM